jgi:tetratricopeptide (TPR) repeat protein
MADADMPRDPEAMFQELLASVDRSEAPRRVQLCRALLQKVSRTDDAEKWAFVQFALGRSLAESPIGNPADNFVEALTCYDLAMQILTRAAYPEAWAKMQYTLGNGYRDPIRRDKGNNLEIAIACYQAAASVFVQHGHPLDRAKVQVGLGNANRERGDVAKAIVFYRAALEILTPDGAPNDWAAAQTGLGLAYADFNGDKAENLEKAIAHHNAALEVSHGPERAAVLTNLANLFKQRMRGDWQENQEEAMERQIAALSIYIRDAFPYEWAIGQVNLGNIYRDRWRDDRALNVERALGYYSAALEIFSRVDFPELWAQVQVELARGFGRRIQGDRAQNIESAISHYEAALQVFTPTSFPQDWAAVQTDLGQMYVERISGNRADNIERGIAYHEAALRVFTEETSLANWALVQRKLAIAFDARLVGTREQNVERSVESCCKSLEAFEMLHMWGDQIDAGKDLGDAAMAAKRWDLAYKGFSTALAAVDVFRERAFTQQSEKQLMEDADRAHWCAIVAAIEMGRPDLALQNLEGAKARVFLKQLGETAHACPTTVPAGWRRVEDGIRHRLRELHAYLGRSQGEQKAQILGGLESAEHDLASVYDRIEPFAPDYVALRRGRPPTLPEISCFMSEQPVGTVMLFLYDIPDRIIALIVRREEVQPVSFTVALDRHHLLGFVTNFLGHMADQPESPYEPSPISWRQLSERLLPRELDPVLNKAQRIHFIPSGILGQLPLHALIWRGEPLAKHFTTLYAPSLGVAMRARARKRTGRTAIAAFGYVKDPSHKAVFEGEARAVAEVFDTNPVVGDLATPDAVVQAGSETRILHISCHGTLDDQDFLRSGLVLAGGLLTVKDVWNWRLPGCLVNLSACLTGRSSISSGDEAYGFVRSFFMAGASSIIVSLWSVDAAVTLRLMRSFYEQVRKGEDRATALGSAMSEVRKDMPHPYYWAPFVLIGDSRSDSGADA